MKLTTDQVNLMRHATRFDRNSYCTSPGGIFDEDWVGLVKNGYASLKSSGRCHNVYMVTDKGKEFLGRNREG